MKKNTTLLLLDRETIPLVRFKNNLIDNMNIRNVVVLEGWGVQNLYDVDYRDDDRFIQFYNTESEFDVGTLIISEPHRYCIFERNVLPFIEKNRATIERIICNWNSQSKGLEELCIKNKIEFYKSEYEEMDIDVSNKVLYQLRVPIVYIASLSEMSDKFACQMKIYNYFKEKGYNVQLIGTKSYSNLLGIRSFPAFMFENKLSNTEKIIAFNHYLKLIEDTDNPDLIIVGIPGEVNGFINGISGHFDDIQYLVSNAAKPDITVLSELYNEVQAPVRLSETIEYKYRWKLDGIFVNNMLLDLQLSQVYGKKEYVRLENKVVEDKVIEANQYKHIPFYSYGNLDNLCENIENKLISYGEENII
ncbi:TIGR04066 family peptide maturation system protein [Paenibacillus macerans]|uniref:TIGR04066 family peptide maturation system protein n=1 Tax=Paenibacillus macerans TaxID=44252 RepID=UPI002DB81846|nr:TIGR04066 family peptide maturation system protein [Paenibacillus macerans]MEC0331737.1 TIGR04066 family peptide maturation system protein [Paenibacillus macerans]